MPVQVFTLKMSWGLGSEKTIGFSTGKRETDEYSVKIDVSIPLLLLIILMTIGHVN